MNRTQTQRRHWSFRLDSLTRGPTIQRPTSGNFSFNAPPRTQLKKMPLSKSTSWPVFAGWNGWTPWLWLWLWFNFLFPDTVSCLRWPNRAKVAKRRPMITPNVWQREPRSVSRVKRPLSANIWVGVVMDRAWMDDRLAGARWQWAAVTDDGYEWIQAAKLAHVIPMDGRISFSSEDPTTPQSRLGHDHWSIIMINLTEFGRLITYWKPPVKIDKQFASQFIHTLNPCSFLFAVLWSLSSPVSSS